MDPLKDLKDSLAGSISDAMISRGLEVAPDDVEITDRTKEDFGDLSTTVALKYASSEGLNPMEVAGEVAASMDPPDLISEVRPVRGYLNSYIDWSRFGPMVVEAILREGGDFGRPGGSPGTLVLEHTSVNPTGPLNIARSRNSIIGDSLARVFEYMGWRVRRLYLLNDVGHQVVAIYWGRTKGIRSESLAERYADYSSKPDFETLFTYVPTMRELSDNPDAEREVAELESRTHTDHDLLLRLRETSEECLRGQLETLGRLDIGFDEITPESRFIEEGRLSDIVSRLGERGVTVEEEDGSVGLDLSSMGLSRRKSEHLTLLKSDGSSTYTLRDMAYHELKFREGDLFITVLGEDHKRQFAELKAALGILGHDEDLRAAFYSFVTYQGGGKMSTRQGKTVPLDNIIDEAITRSEAEVRKRRDGLSPEEVRAIATQVGLGAIKFNVLKVDTNKSIQFNWEEAIDFEGDSSAYVQYACARASSILKNAKGWEPPDDMGMPTNADERRLIWSLAQAPGVVARSHADMKPNYLAEHSIEVSSLFNRFYMKHRVLQVDEPKRSARLALTMSTKLILETLLGLMGIAAPEEI